ELQIAINVWLDRAPDFTLPSAERAGLRYNTMGMFSLHHLPLQWTPKA
ncbi:MAG: cytochrome, partial [Frankiales bacterium]|nr:cytochrome [Frankiales bacterium]